MAGSFLRVAHLAAALAAPPEGTPPAGGEPADGAVDIDASQEPPDASKLKPHPRPTTTTSRTPPATPPPSQEDPGRPNPGTIADSPPPPDDPASADGESDADADSPDELDGSGEELEARRIEVRTVGEQMERSAESVQVVETSEEQHKTADMGQLLARTRGVTLRRRGGLGSSSVFALGGLDGAQVPLFIDGVPITFSPFSLDPSNVPVGFVDRVEIYQGVVPVRFGADTLGGAVNFVRDLNVYGPRSSVAYQVGSFDTHRVAASSETLLRNTNIYVGAFGFFDHTNNDYEIDVQVAQMDGTIEDARVHKRRDRYLAGGGGLTVGVVDKPWADRLLVTGFASALHKQIPHNVVMTVPYGSVEYGEVRPGANLRYAKAFTHDVELEITGAYTHRQIAFEDEDRCVYDWYGRCIVERATGGEITFSPIDQVIWQNGGYGNASLSWSPGRHALRVTMAPSGFARTGRDDATLPGLRDPLTAQRSLFNLVSGLEYAVDLFDEHLENVVFFKDYLQVVRAEEAIAGATDYPSVGRTGHEVGVGDAIRYAFADWVYAKASYEWATRLPSVDEIFGDGVLVTENLELRPERSHNANLAVALDLATTRAGAFRVDMMGAARFLSDAIAPIPEDIRVSSQNVNAARSLSFEAAAGWTSPGDYFSIDGNVTYVDFRNTSDGGPYGPYDGDRMPARPWLTANGRAGVGFGDVAVRGDRIGLDWNTHYVHAFYRGWESAGSTAFKQEVPTQLLHGIGLTYRVIGARRTVSAALELHNLLDAKAYDYIGVQLPTRNVQAKLSVAF